MEARRLRPDLALIASDIPVNQHNAANGNFRPNRGEMGHIYSAADMNFSGEYFAALTVTGLIHLFLPLEKTKEEKSRVRILKKVSALLPSSPVIISDWSRWGGGVVAVGSRLWADFPPTLHKKKQNESSLFINRLIGNQS